MVRVTFIIVRRARHYAKFQLLQVYFVPTRRAKMTRSGIAKDLACDLPTPESESPRAHRKPYRFSTLCATVENPSMKDQYGSSSVPIYQTATFKGVAGEYDYTRSGNPTRSHLRMPFLHVYELL